jgi:hypothetical protein
VIPAPVDKERMKNMNIFMGIIVFILAGTLITEKNDQRRKDCLIAFGIVFTEFVAMQIIPLFL